jgi:hypothetical protein
MTLMTIGISTIGGSHLYCQHTVEFTSRVSVRGLRTGTSTKGQLGELLGAGKQLRQPSQS